MARVDIFLPHLQHAPTEPPSLRLSLLIFDKPGTVPAVPSTVRRRGGARCTAPVVAGALRRMLASPPRPVGVARPAWMPLQTARPRSVLDDLRSARASA